MLSKKLKQAGKYVKELNEKLAGYRQFTKENIPKLFDKEKRRKRKPPKDFKESSFLYIRSYDGDIGVRPFSNINFWNSPDVTVAPVTDTAAYTQTLDAGKAYQFSCTVRNRGDLIVPSANVEFFLVTPSLGFDTRFAKKLGVTGGWVNSQGATRVAIQYTIPGAEGGHKCLFARTFAFSPLDIPVDDYQLSPPIDRHIGQLNLNIIAQSSAYAFNLVHLPNAMERIAFMPMTQAQVMALRHPFLADFKMGKRAAADIIQGIKIEPVEKRNADMKMKKDGAVFNITMTGKEGWDINRQAEIMKSVTGAIQAINAGKAKQAQFKELFKAYREMNKPMQHTGFKMRIPDFGLQKGEAIGVQIVNTNMVNGEMKGGITLIVTG